LTKTLHAPGGATAFNIIMTTTNFSWYSFQYIVMPTVIGTIILLIIAVIINNLSPKRHYSLPWW
jgi:CBS-domain-containing membrane protein